uniref:Putative transmembrane protein n=1 Tax=Toxoplasma gondii TgCATBr9 TaxID=943120 RepID=A0A2T6IV56_TOXGO|nr:putative transmembrane protein [Toxoplasma gondii TgCATBr9]
MAAPFAIGVLEGCEKSATGCMNKTLPRKNCCTSVGKQNGSSKIISRSHLQGHKRHVALWPSGSVDMSLSICLVASLTFLQNRFSSFFLSCSRFRLFLRLSSTRHLSLHFLIAVKPSLSLSVALCARFSLSGRCCLCELQRFERGLRCFSFSRFQATATKGADSVKGSVGAAALVVLAAAAAVFYILNLS